MKAANELKEADSSLSTAYVALGSNLGDRRVALSAAVAALDADVDVSVGFSSGVACLYETDPVGGPPGQPPFLNTCVRVTTARNPQSLLALLLSIEQALGRGRDQRCGPRVIDLDLLFYDDRIQTDGELILPHPRLHERRFVLEPLADIAADFAHPALGVTIERLAARCRLDRSSQSVRRIDDPQWWRSARVPSRP